MSAAPCVRDCDVQYYLRDKDSAMVQEWTRAFAAGTDTGCIEISQGDFFQNAPAVDAIVSPGNSFGFMDEGTADKAISKQFGPQLQVRLRREITNKYDGEVLVGQAVTVPCYPPGDSGNTQNWTSGKNDGVPIKYLILAPTMRTPLNVANSANAYLAFRAVIKAVRQHNQQDEVYPIRSVLCPGLGTGGGGMSKAQCAAQMFQAYETHALGYHEWRFVPDSLQQMIEDHKLMTK